MKKVALVSLITLNIFDLVSTMIMLDAGLIREANPLMAPIWECGGLAFAMVKITLVGLGAGIIWANRDRKIGKIGLAVTNAAYLWILVRHMVCFAGMKEVAEHLAMM